MFWVLLIQIPLFIVSALIIIGLYKPHWVLWWLGFKNRLTVLKYYGLVWLILFTINLLF